MSLNLFVKRAVLASVNSSTLSCLIVPTFNFEPKLLSMPKPNFCITGFAASKYPVLEVAISFPTRSLKVLVYAFTSSSLRILVMSFKTFLLSLSLLKFFILL